MPKKIVETVLDANNVIRKVVDVPTKKKPNSGKKITLQMRSIIQKKAKPKK